MGYSLSGYWHFYWEEYTLKYKYRIIKRYHYSADQDKFYEWFDLEQESVHYGFIKGFILKQKHWYTLQTEKSIERIKEWLEKRIRELKAEERVRTDRTVVETFELDVDFIGEDEKRRRRYIY